MSSSCPAVFFSLKDEELPHGNIYNERKDVQQSDYAVWSRIFSLQSVIRHPDVQDYLQQWLRVFGIDIKTILKVTSYNGRCSSPLFIGLGPGSH